jgi:hypothetical protein
MKQTVSRRSLIPVDSNRPWPWLRLLVVITITIVVVRFAGSPKETNPESGQPEVVITKTSAVDSAARPRSGPISVPVAAATPQEIVAAKLDQFVRGRRALVLALALEAGIPVPAEVEQFFDLAERGQWAEAEALYAALKVRRERGEGSGDLSRLSPAMLETIGVHEAVRDWPAQALLNYGSAILEALPPGAVYMGGSDPGRFIPTLLNETTAGDRHVVLTQNALADQTYLDYARFLYGDHVATLTADDSQRAFQDYMADAAQRLAHDQQFPGEPKQVRPGEDIQRTDDGRIQVGGQVAVMAINERMLKTLMEKNPDLPFALEESYPFSSLYEGATLRGPLVELRAGSGEGEAVIDSARATQSLNYWRERTQQVLADPETSDSTEARTAYARQVLAQAGLMQQHQLPGEAEQAFRLANQLAPGNPEVVQRFVGLLTEQQRITDAIPVAEAALRLAPDNEQFRNLLEELRTRGKN